MFSKKLSLKRLAAFGLSAILISLVIVQAAFAQFLTIPKDESYIMESDEVIDGNLFIAGEEIRLYGTITGDLYAAGGVLEIAGTVNGDVYSTGGQVIVSGTVGQDLHVIAGEFDMLNATIGDSVIIASGDVTTDLNTSIGGNMIFATGVAQVASSVGRDIVGATGLFNFSGATGGDLLLAADDLKLVDGASVSGDFVYRAEDQAYIANDVTVAGETVFKEINWDKYQFNPADWMKTAVNWIMILISFIFTLVLGAVLIPFFPKQFAFADKAVQKRPILSPTVGFLSFVSFFVVLLITMVLVITWPLTALVGLSFALYLLVNKVFIGYLYGEWIQRLFGWPKLRPFVSFMIGLAVFMLLVQVPFVGVVIQILSFFTAFGAQMAMSYELLKKFKKGRV